MNLNFYRSQLINWENINAVETWGAAGLNISKEFNLENIKIRLSEYSAYYKSAEWCSKGHIIYCIEGEMIIQLKSEINIKLAAGNSLILGENEPHIAVTGNSSAKIFIVD